MIFTRSYRSIGELGILFVTNDMTVTSVSEFLFSYFGESQKQWETMYVPEAKPVFCAFYSAIDNKEKRCTTH